jgi:hypothetical protein
MDGESIAEQSMDDGHYPMESARQRGDDVE